MQLDTLIQHVREVFLFAEMTLFPFEQDCVESLRTETALAVPSCSRVCGMTFASSSSGSFVNLEATMVDKVCIGTCWQLFHSEQLISQTENAASNSGGVNTPSIVDLVLDHTRKLIIALTV